MAYRCERCGKKVGIKITSEGKENATNGLMEFYLRVQVPGFSLVTTSSVGPDRQQAAAARKTLMTVLGIEEVP